MKDAVVSNIHVMDELARLLDQPICHGNQDVSFTQYWLHLAEEFKVSEEIVIRCQHNPENSPSKNMLEFQKARDPYFPVQTFKDALRDIARNDLVKMLEQCGEFSYFPSDNGAYFKKSVPLYDILPEFRPREITLLHGDYFKIR